VDLLIAVSCCILPAVSLLLLWLTSDVSPAPEAVRQQQQQQQQ
jgi:hypothetical protein